MLIDRAPEPLSQASTGDCDFVQVPFVPEPRQLLGNLISESPPEPQAPLPHRLVAEGMPRAASIPSAMRRLREKCTYSQTAWLWIAGGTDGRYSWAGLISSCPPKQLPRQAGHRQLDDALPAEDILILDYTEMGRDLHSFLQRICRFLDTQTIDRSVTNALAGQRHWVEPVRPVAAAEQKAIQRQKSDHELYSSALLDLF